MNYIRISGHLQRKQVIIMKNHHEECKAIKLVCF